VSVHILHPSFLTRRGNIKTMPRSTEQENPTHPQTIADVALAMRKMSDLGLFGEDIVFQIGIHSGVVAVSISEPALGFDSSHMPISTLFPLFL